VEITINFGITAELESSKRGKGIRVFGSTAKSDSRAVARILAGRTLDTMKVKSPTVIALVLWFLFFISHAFAMFRSPYPTKVEAPDQTIIISDSSAGPIIGTTDKAN
jgi:hypothetical protein